MDLTRITAQVRSAVGAGFEAGLQQANSRMGSLVSLLAERFNSNTRIQPHSATSQLPDLVDETAVGQALAVDLLATKSYQVTNAAASRGIRVNLDDIDDDLTGQYGRRARSLGMAANYHFYNKVIQVVNDAFTAGKTGFDGKLLCATDHPRDLTGSGSGTNSNTASSAALSTDTFNTGVAAMQNFQDAAGRKPWNVALDLVLLVPPALRKAALEVATAGLVGGGNTNVNAGFAEVIVSPQLTDADNWFIINRANSGKAVLWQVRQNPRLDEDRTKIVSENSLIYRARYRGAVVPWDYTGIYGAQG